MTDEEYERDKGMELAANNNADLLAIARAHADRLGADRRITDIEEVRDAMIEAGECFIFGNWMGSVFKSAYWTPVGLRKCYHTGSHARVVRRWQHTDQSF